MKQTGNSGQAKPNSHDGAHQDHAQGSANHPQHGDGHESHHAQMVSDFRQRFWISFALTVPVLALAPLIQGLLSIEELLRFPGQSYILFGFASAIFFYGGWPFLKGLFQELARRQPGMMTLIGMAITVAYVYSSAVVFGLSGDVFFWELATLIDIMLLGHWIEMRSVMGASGALEKLVQLMPAHAHLVRESGGTVDVPVTEVTHGDRVLVKPGEKIPVDGIITEGRNLPVTGCGDGTSSPGVSLPHPGFCGSGRSLVDDHCAQRRSSHAVRLAVSGREFSFCPGSNGYRHGDHLSSRAGPGHSPGRGGFNRYVRKKRLADSGSICIRESTATSGHRL